MKRDNVYFITSDIHSYYTKLREALDKAGWSDKAKHHILVCLGDLFDRGDESKELLDFVQKLGDRFIYIKGNHEYLLKDALDEIYKGQFPSSHHWHNGTINTICQLADMSIMEMYALNDTRIEKIRQALNPVLEYIETKSVPYIELDKYILVHSWIPLDDYDYLGDWKAASTDKWISASWGNPFIMWKNKLYPENNCIIFGHWHCSYGNSIIDMKTKEWPQKNQLKAMDKAFMPWVKENAIGIDACTAYSGKVNILKYHRGELYYGSKALN